MSETTSLETVKEVDYSIEDPAFDEPFEVYKSANAWWIQEKNGRGKVEKLIDSFKQCMKVNQAIILAGISIDQWRYFNEQHPKFSRVKARCEELANMFAKATVVSKIKNDWKAAAWFLERREPDMFGTRDKVPVGLPEGGSVATLIQEAFMDKDGNLIRKRKTLTIDNGEQSTTTTADSNA